MSEYTPGPWVVESNIEPEKWDSEYALFAVGPPFNLGDGLAEAVALNVLPQRNVDGYREANDSANANAHLIAAAPDLLMALEHCVASMQARGFGDADGSALTEAMLAIAKAKVKAR